MAEKNIYQQRGYEDRKDYIEDVADEYGVPAFAAFMLADVLGDGEDFDGLVSMLEDADECGWFD